MRSVDSFNFNGKKALIRVDFNVPIDKNIVTDSSRILAAKNTVDKVCNDGGSCILMSHLGRPNGFQLEYSLSKIVKTVESVLNKKVFFSQDVIGKDAIKKSSELKQGEVLLLENVRKPLEILTLQEISQNSAIAILMMLLVPHIELTLQQQLLQGFLKISFLESF
jgi:phosphoglycerate kinase